MSGFDEKAIEEINSLLKGVPDIDDNEVSLSIIERVSNRTNFILETEGIIDVDTYDNELESLFNKLLNSLSDNSKKKLKLENPFDCISFSEGISSSFFSSSIEFIIGEELSNEKISLIIFLSTLSILMYKTKETRCIEEFINLKKYLDSSFPFNDFVDNKEKYPLGYFSLEYTSFVVEGLNMDTSDEEYDKLKNIFIKYSCIELFESSWDGSALTDIDNQNLNSNFIDSLRDILFLSDLKIETIHAFISFLHFVPMFKLVNNDIDDSLIGKLKALFSKKLF